MQEGRFAPQTSSMTSLMLPGSFRFVLDPSGSPRILLDHAGSSWRLLGPGVFWGLRIWLGLRSCWKLLVALYRSWGAPRVQGPKGAPLLGAPGGLLGLQGAPGGSWGLLGAPGMTWIRCRIRNECSACIETNGASAQRRVAPTLFTLPGPFQKPM